MKNNTNKNCWSSFTTIDQLIEIDKKESIVKAVIEFTIAGLIGYVLIIIILGM